MTTTRPQPQLQFKITVQRSGAVDQSAYRKSWAGARKWAEDNAAAPNHLPLRHVVVSVKDESFHLRDYRPAAVLRNDGIWVQPDEIRRTTDNLRAQATFLTDLADAIDGLTAGANAPAVNPEPIQVIADQYTELELWGAELVAADQDCKACDDWEYGDGVQCPIHGEEARFRGENLDTGAPLATYEIRRFYSDDRPAETIVRGLTLAQAQAHCKRDDTKGDGWFDGYEEVAQ